MTNTAIATTKQPSKTTLAVRFYRTKLTKAILTAGTDEAKATIRAANKECKDHFMTVLGMSMHGASTYISICRDVVVGNDPHAGRKAANKARTLRLATTETVEQEVVEPVAPTVDLTQRWGVGATKGQAEITFASRAQAQAHAKETGMKWFDTKVA